MDATAPPPPPPPPPASPPPSASASPSAASAGGVRPPPLELAPRETTIGKYIARFRFGQPRPRDARAAVDSGDFWWTRSPRYKRSQSPSSAASASPGRSRASVFDLEDEDSLQGKENAPSDSNDGRATSRGLYRSLDDLERRVREDLSEAPSLASSWSSVHSLTEDTAASRVAVESAAEDPEVVIERVRRRLGWRSASYSIRDAPAPRGGGLRPADHSIYTTATATASGTPSPLGVSPGSRSYHDSVSSRVDSDSPATGADHWVGEETASSPSAASVSSNTARLLLGSPSDDFDIPSAAAGHSPSESSPTLRAVDSIDSDAAGVWLASLSLQLDPTIGSSSPASVSTSHSPAIGDEKQTPDSRSQFTLSQDVPDLRFHAAAHADASPSNNNTVERKDERLEPRTPNDEEGGEDVRCAPDAVTSTTSPVEVDDTLRTPREATPPRATPPLPPTRSRLASAASSTRGSSPVETRVPKEDPDDAEESPHTAAEQVLDTLVGFVVHSWSEDEESGDDTQSEKHIPVSVASDTSQASQSDIQATSDQPAVSIAESQHLTIKGETEDGNGEALDSPTDSTSVSISKSDAGEAVLMQAGDVHDTKSEDDEDTPLDLDEDYAREDEHDEMALLLVARIAVFKEALRRMKDQEARNATHNETL